MKTPEECAEIAADLLGQVERDSRFSPEYVAAAQVWATLALRPTYLDVEPAVDTLVMTDDPFAITLGARVAVTTKLNGGTGIRYVEDALGTVVGFTDDERALVRVDAIDEDEVPVKGREHIVPFDDLLRVRDSA